MALIMRRACCGSHLKTSLQYAVKSTKRVGVDQMNCATHLLSHKLVANGNSNIHLRTYYRLSTHLHTQFVRQKTDYVRTGLSVHAGLSAHQEQSLIALSKLHSVRYSSSFPSFGAASTETANSTDTILEVANNVNIADIGDAANVLSPALEPTLSSLGLACWTPSGLVQAGLEAIHVGLDVPWWTAIVIGTICVRLAIFPLVILAQRNAAHMHNHMPTMQRLQERVTVARMSGDAREAVKASNELMEYMRRNDVSLFRNVLVPLAQMPIFVSVFIGVRKMAALPVLSMKTGGILWFTDLTIQDPFYALPLMTMATLLATIEVGVDGVKAGEMGGTIKYVMRALPFFVFPFIIKFPAAMLCYWFTSNAFSLVQVLFLKIPGMREFFKIPKLIDHGKSVRMRERNIPKKSFMEGFRETMTNLRLASEIQERQRMNALQLKESRRLSSQPQQQHITSSQTSSSKEKETK